MSHSDSLVQQASRRLPVGQLEEKTATIIDDGDCKEKVVQTDSFLNNKRSISLEQAAVLSRGISVEQGIVNIRGDFNNRDKPVGYTEPIHHGVVSVEENGLSHGIPEIKLKEFVGDSDEKYSTLTVEQHAKAIIVDGQAVYALNGKAEKLGIAVQTPPQIIDPRKDVFISASSEDVQDQRVPVVHRIDKGNVLVNLEDGHSNDGLSFDVRAAPSLARESRTSAPGRRHIVHPADDLQPKETSPKVRFMDVTLDFQGGNDPVNEEHKEPLLIDGNHDLAISSVHGNYHPESGSESLHTSTPLLTKEESASLEGETGSMDLVSLIPGSLISNANVLTTPNLTANPNYTVATSSMSVIKASTAKVGKGSQGKCRVKKYANTIPAMSETTTASNRLVTLVNQLTGQTVETVISEASSPHSDTPLTSTLSTSHAHLAPATVTSSMSTMDSGIGKVPPVSIVSMLAQQQQMTTEAMQLHYPNLMSTISPQGMQKNGQADKKSESFIYIFC